MRTSLLPLSLSFFVLAVAIVSCGKLLIYSPPADSKTCVGTTLALTASADEVLTLGTVTLTATGGAGGNLFRVSSGDGTITSGGIFTAPAAAGTTELEVLDSSSCSVRRSINVREAKAKLYLAFDQSGPSRTSVFGYELDYGSNTLTALNPASLMLSSGISTIIRGFGFNAAGEILAGFDNPSGARLSLAATAPMLQFGTSVTFSGGGGSAISQLHAVCALPNGNLIAANFGNSAQGRLNEYDSNGAYLRDVYVSELPGGSFGSVSQCIPTSNDSMLIIDSAAATVNNGEIRQIDRVGGIWTGSTNRSGFLAAIGGTTGTAIFTGAVHANGNVYLPSVSRAGAQLKKMIRCPVANLSACAAYGDDIPQTGFPHFALYVAKLPLNDDILLLQLSGRLERFSPTTGVFTPIIDFDAGAGASVNQVLDFNQARGLLIR